MAPAEFEDIFRGLNPTPGRFKLAPTGMGWKPFDSKSLVTVPKEEIKWAQWIKVARGYQLRIGLNRDRSDLISIGDRRRITFDGFRVDDQNQLANSLKQNYDITLETKDMSLRGWNWGKVDVQASDLAFMVAGKPSFEVPLAYVHNATINKTEVAVEFLDPAALQPKPDAATSSSGKGRRGVTDQLVELRLYVPGNAPSNNAAGSNVESDVDDAVDGDGDGTTAAQVIHDMIMEKAEIGRVQGEGIITLDDVLCTTPRGRYDIDMYSDFLRLRGKTYDYKVLYSSIQRLFLLPKPDDIHFNFVVQLDPPIRQGQTRYPFLVMQFATDEEMDAVLNLDDETLMSKFGQEHNKIEGRVHEVVSVIFKGLANKNVIVPHSISEEAPKGTKCSIKTNEGLVYFLEKFVLFISKQPVLVALPDLHSVKFARVGGALQSGRTFDLVLTKKDETDVQLSSLSKEEHVKIDKYFKEKGKKVLNEMNEDTMMGAMVALSDDEDEQMDGSSDNDARSRERKAPRGEANEDDSESDDEDFKVGEEDSDVAEEFDSNYEDSSSDEEEEEPAKKEKPPADSDEPPAKKQKK